MDLKTAKRFIFLSLLISQSIWAGHSEQEPNNNAGAANPYILGIPMSGDIAYGEEDWFYFETLVDHLFLDIFRRGEFLQIEVFNSDLELIFTGGGGQSQIANIGLEKAGRYYIRLRGHNSEYEFTARLSDEPVCNGCEAMRGNNATFDPNTGMVFIRTIDVFDIFGGRVPYEVELKQLPQKNASEPLKFELIRAERIFK